MDRFTYLATAIFSVLEEDVIARTPEDVLQYAREVGFPHVSICLVPTFNFGATIAVEIHTEAKLREVVEKAFRLDPYALFKVIPATDSRFWNRSQIA